MSYPSTFKTFSNKINGISELNEEKLKQLSEYVFDPLTFKEYLIGLIDSDEFELTLRLDHEEFGEILDTTIKCKPDEKKCIVKL